MNSQSTDYWDKAVIAEIDGLLDDDGQELIVSGTNLHETLVEYLH